MTETRNSITKEPFTRRIRRVGQNIQATSLNSAKLIWVIRRWDQAVIKAVDLKKCQDLTYSAWPGVGCAGRDPWRGRSHHHPGHGVCSQGPPATNLWHAVRGERLIKVYPSLPKVAIQAIFLYKLAPVFLVSQRRVGHWDRSLSSAVLMPESFFSPSFFLTWCHIEQLRVASNHCFVYSFYLCIYFIWFPDIYRLPCRRRTYAAVVSLLGLLYLLLRNF